MEYKTTAYAPPISPALTETKKSARQPVVESDVVVPLLQSLVTALTLGGAFTMLTWGGGWLPAWPTFGVAAAVVLAGSWLFYLFLSRQTLWMIERYTGQDLNQDGRIGGPQVHPFPVNPRQGQQAAAEAAEQAWRKEFASFIRRCETETSQRFWEKRVGRDKLTEWRGLLITQGFAAWNNPGDQRAGWKLLQPSEAIIARIFTRPAPAPLAEAGQNP